MEWNQEPAILAQPHELEPFRPPRWAQGKHRQTVLAHLFNRARELTDTRFHQIALDDSDRLMLQENRPTAGAPSTGTVLLLHGLGGDATSVYMLSAARRFVEIGWPVFRLNLRGAGSGAGLAQRMYHSGLSSDIDATLRWIGANEPARRVVAVGFSMSGNTLLKYLGERGQAAADCLGGAIAVNPPIDLARTVQQLESGSNTLYHHRFTHLLKQQVRVNRRATGRPDGSRLRCRTIREFDTRFTAPSWGFADANEYYRRASALPRLTSIARPTAVLMCDDDPFVPVEPIESASWPDEVRLLITRGGGHMGFLSQQTTPLGDRRWLDYALITLAQAVLFPSPPNSSVGK